MITNPLLPTNIGNFTNSFAGAGSLSQIIQVLVNVAFGLGGLIFFAMLILGAYEYMTSGGDKEGTQKASKRMTTGIIGLVILLSIFAIIFVINAVFGFNILRLNLPYIDPNNSSPTATHFCAQCTLQDSAVCTPPQTAQIDTSCYGLTCFRCI